MINDINRKVRPGDKIYKIYWKPVNDKATWLYSTYVIKDMYYSDNCYVILENEVGDIKEIAMTAENLVYWFTSEDAAIEAVKREQSIPRGYAWGNCNPLKIRNTVV